MASERQPVPSNKLPRSERRELVPVAGELAHTTSNGTANVNRSLLVMYPDLDRSANAFEQPLAESTGANAAPAYPATESRLRNPAMSEIVPDFVDGFSTDVYWNGSLATDSDTTTEPGYRPVTAADIGGDYQPTQPANNPYSEATSAPDVSMAGMTVDPHKRYVEAVQPGGVYDQIDQADMAEDARRQIDSAHAQGGQQ